VRHAFHALAIDEQRPAFRPALWSAKTSPGQRVEQVWFAGAHSNVGGGYPEAGLSDEAFVWMRDRAEECGLAFDDHFIEARVRANSMGTLRDSYTGFYRLSPRYSRPIGEAAPQNEAVHPSALHRYYTEAAAYRPRNLGMYLASPLYRLWAREATQPNERAQPNEPAQPTPPAERSDPAPGTAPPAPQPVPGIVAIPTG